MTDANERLTGILTICRKAGKLVLGFDAVKEATQQGQVFAILLAADVSPKTEKEIRFFSGEIPVRKLSMDMETLRHWFRKRTAVYGIGDEGFSGKVLSLLPDEQAQNM